MIGLRLIAVLCNLCGKFFNVSELDLIAGLFYEFHFNLLPVKFLIKIENVRFHVFLKGAYGWLDSDICDARIFHPVVNAVGDIYAVRRRYHAFVNHNVRGRKSDRSSEPVSHDNFSADVIIPAKILRTFFHFAIIMFRISVELTTSPSMETALTSFT